MAPQSQSPAADVLLALSKYDSAIDQLRQASRHPCCRFPLQSPPIEDANQFLSVNLAPLKDCGGVLRLRAVAELEIGQNEKAFEDVKLMLRLANYCHGGTGLLPEVHRALQPVWQGLVDHKWSDTELSGIEEELAKFDLLSEYQYCVRRQCAEVIGEIDAAEHRRLHDFWAQFYLGNDPDGRSLPERIFSEDTLFDFMPKGWFYENDVAAARICQQFLRTEGEVDRRIISSGVYDQGFQAINSKHQHPSPRNFIASALCATAVPSARGFAFAQTSVDQARVACALERHRLANGEYPNALDVLAPRFIEKIPHDIINDQPLHYRRMEDGQFLLYSVGWNGKDDGGVAVRQQNPVGRRYVCP